MMPRIPWKCAKPRNVVCDGLLAGRCDLPAGFVERLLAGRGEPTLTQIDDYLADVAGKLERHLLSVVLYHGCPGIHSHVHRLVERETDRDCAFDLSLRGFLAVHRERACAAFTVAGAVIFEVNF